MKICVILGYLLASLAVSRAEIGNVQITFKVTDDSGKPVAGATVRLSTVRAKSLLIPISVSNAEVKQIDAVTDKEGMV